MTVSKRCARWTRPPGRVARVVAPLLAMAGLAAPASAMPLPPQLEGEPAPFSMRPPLADPLAAALRDRLARPDGGEAGGAAGAIAAFYAARDHAPLWMTLDGPTADAERVIALFRSARADGLVPRDYLSLMEPPAPIPIPAVHPLRRPPPAGDGGARVAALGEVAPPAPSAAETMAAREIALARAVLRYARDAQAGRVAPGRISRIITLAPRAPDPAAVLAALADSADPAETLAGYHPPHPAFARLRGALADALADDVVPPPRVPAGPNLRRGDRHPHVAIVRARLGETVRRGTDPTIFDAHLARAVRAFQRERGLAADGIVGPRTRAAFNAASDADLAAVIAANMERWRWMPRDLGRRHVFVNVPAFTVEVVDAGAVDWRGRAIVGRPSNPTPMFSDAMDHVVVNPYWNVPYSIAAGELLPSIRRNPTGYMARRGYEVVRNGRVVHPSSVRWTRETLRRVRIRQRPGRGNALGAIKFMFPNRHAVYLHDTPSKHLFERSRRAFSHGCVRVDRPFAFATALLENDGTVTGARLRAMVGGGARRMNLATPIPVHLAYFTVEVAADGTITRHADLYGFDARLKRALAR